MGFTPGPGRVFFAQNFEHNPSISGPYQKNCPMPRLIVFILCIAFLVGAGVSVRAGMVLAALGVIASVVCLVWRWFEMFDGPRK